jgi:hypothetical protein
VYLRLVEPSRLQGAGACCRRGCPEYDGRMGLSAQRYVWHGSRNQGARLELEESQMDWMDTADASNPGGWRGRVSQIKGVGEYKRAAAGAER